MEPVKLRLEALKLAVAACEGKGDPGLVLETAKLFLELVTAPPGAANRRAA